MPPWVAKEKMGTLLLPQKCRFPFRRDVLYVCINGGASRSVTQKLVLTRSAVSEQECGDMKERDVTEVDGYVVTR